MKKWVQIIILTKTLDTNEDLSPQSCPYGLECSIVSNIFVVLGHLVHAFEGQIET